MGYYIGIGTEPRGPFEVHELRDQGAMPETLVWTDGMTQWARADNIAELAAQLAPAVAPSYPASPAPFNSPYNAAVPVFAYAPSRGNYASVNVPIMISGICNIVVALMWILTCFGSIFAVPLIVLAIFEFQFVAQSSSSDPSRVRSKAQTLAILEILTILLGNIFSLVCGIIAIVNLPKNQCLTLY